MAVWRGDAEHEYGEAAVIGTTLAAGPGGGGAREALCMVPPAAPGVNGSARDRPDDATSALAGMSSSGGGGGVGARAPQPQSATPGEPPRERRVGALVHHVRVDPRRE